MIPQSARPRRSFCAVKRNTSTIILEKIFHLCRELPTEQRVKYQGSSRPISSSCTCYVEVSQTTERSCHLPLFHPTSPMLDKDAAAAMQAKTEVPEEAVEVLMDVDILIQGFQECLKEEALGVDGYVRAYTEMTKFFEGLGTMFNFITSDLVSKLNILRCYRKGGAADYYTTVQSMLQYEKDQPSLTQPSASRTLLRLHRALKFVTCFLREMVAVSMETKLGPIAKPIYADTLAKFHPWLISKTVGAVLLLLPDKKVMVTRLFGESEASQRKSLEKFPDLVKLMDKVYEATQKFYTDYDMLNLP